MTHSLLAHHWLIGSGSGSPPSMCFMFHELMDYQNSNCLIFPFLGYGTSGWQAPEQLLHERQTRAVDLFSLGCVLFFCITGGKHPFGDSLERDVNIVNNRKDLFLIENIPESVDLISRLLDRDAESRYNVFLSVILYFT